MIQQTNGSSTTLSPRDLAKAIGVSESSVKRWVDAGRLPAWRTSGGHRRIELISAIRFVQETELSVAQPELLGLTSAEPGQVSGLEEGLYELLLAGKGEEATRLVLTAHVVLGRSIADLFDGPLRGALERIGGLWQGEGEGTFQERRAVQDVLQILDRLGGLFESSAAMPVAVGGSIEGDASLIPTRMVATLLDSEGFRSVNLGADCPVPVLLEAAEATAARLVWVSANQLSNPGEQGEALRQLARVLANRGVQLAVGGSESHRLGLGADEVFFVGDSLKPLAELVRDLPRSRAAEAQVRATDIF